MDIQSNAARALPRAGGKKLSKVMNVVNLTIYGALAISLWQSVIYLGSHCYSLYQESLLNQLNTLGQLFDSTHFGMPEEEYEGNQNCATSITSRIEDLEWSVSLLEQKLTQKEQQLDHEKAQEMQIVMDENVNRNHVDLDVKDEMLKAFESILNQLKSLERYASALEGKPGEHKIISGRSPKSSNRQTGIGVTWGQNLDVGRNYELDPANTSHEKHEQADHAADDSRERSIGGARKALLRNCFPFYQT